MKIRHFTYTKDNGEASDRSGIVVSRPRENFLVYDVSKLTNLQAKLFVQALEEAEEYRSDTLSEFEGVTGINLNSLWRSFKPGGIDWEE